MKFGKRLEKQMNPKWISAYIDYKKLKKLIRAHPERFMEELASQLGTVNSFYEATADQFTGTLKELTMSVQQQVSLDRTVFAEFWSDLNHFRTYVMLNYMAVIKIVKKWNKKAAEGRAALDAFAILHLQPFYHSRCFAHLLVRAEMLALCYVSPAAVERSDWTCPVCLDILCNPVILDCSHRFCWVCITKSLETSDCCPVCRKRLVLDEDDVHVDEPLEKFLTQHCPTTFDESPAADPPTSPATMGPHKSSAGIPFLRSGAELGKPFVALLKPAAPCSPSKNLVEDDLEDLELFSRDKSAVVKLAQSTSGCGSGGGVGGARRKALVIGIDSMPTNALLLGPTDQIRRVLLSGRYSLAKAGVPGVLPTWACMLTGLREGRHGIADGRPILPSGDPGKVATFLRTLMAKGFPTAALATSGALNGLVEGEVDLLLPVAASIEDTDSEVLDFLVKLLKEGDCPDATFVYLDGPRRAGGFHHRSRRYIQAARQVNTRVSEFLSGITQRKGEEWLVILTSSDGGPVRPSPAAPEQGSNLTFLGVWHSGVRPSEIFP
eukprot:RCo027933